MLVVMQVRTVSQFSGVYRCGYRKYLFVFFVSKQNDSARHWKNIFQQLFRTDECAWRVPVRLTHLWRMPIFEHKHLTS